MNAYQKHYAAAQAGGMNETDSHEFATDQATRGLTEASKALFLAYAEDAGNWSGTPCVGGNVGGSKADAGNLTDLKKKGLVTTYRDEGCEWVVFTPVGVEFAKANGIELT